MHGADASGLDVPAYLRRRRVWLRPRRDGQRRGVFHFHAAGIRQKQPWRSWSEISGQGLVSFLVGGVIRGPRLQDVVEMGEQVVVTPLKACTSLCRRPLFGGCAGRAL